MSTQTEVSELQQVVRKYLADRRAADVSRESLDADGDAVPPWWGEVMSNGWLTAHLPDDLGGGAGWGAVVAVLHEFGRAAAPGPATAVVAGSAMLARHPDPRLRAALTHAVGSGATSIACQVDPNLRLGDRERLDGRVMVMNGGTADLFVLRTGEDLVILRRDQAGVRVGRTDGIDVAHRYAELTLADVSVAPGHRIPGAGPLGTAQFRAAVAAQAGGAARHCLEATVEYTKVRRQFDRPVGSFQAVKHHCADMLVEFTLADAAVWYAAHALDTRLPAEAVSMAAAVAAEVATRALARNSRRMLLLHGGTGFGWEHSTHLYLRRATALRGAVGGAELPSEIADAGFTPLPPPRIEIPAAAEASRLDLRRAAEEAASVPDRGAVAVLVRHRLAMPHWPRPWGRDATPAEQYVIDQELDRAGVARPRYSMTGWILGTILMHGTPQQAARWVERGLLEQEIWCQLFSEPGAGSDAAAISTRGERVPSGWLVSGYKIWTTRAHEARWGLATVRTDPSAEKHAGITMMVIDMTDPRVTVRPIRQITGESRFNEVTLDQVRVPDDQIVGAVGAGWSIARSTLGTERSTMGTGLVEDRELWRHIDRWASTANARGEKARIGGLFARAHAAEMIHSRQVVAQVQQTLPPPAAGVTKILRATNRGDASEVLVELAAARAAGRDGADGQYAASQALEWPRFFLAGGTLEILKNQLAERSLGLPREPPILVSR